MYFKDKENKLHWLDDATHVELLPKDSVEITDEEAEQIRLDSIAIPPVPLVVSMRQARLALLQVGLLGVVQSAIDNGSQEDKITWEFSTEVARDFPVVQNFKTTLGLSEGQLDDLFTLASTL
jgi:hypothetical protein